MGWNLAFFMVGLQVMRNLIIITSIVFIAIIVASYFYFSKLEKNEFYKQAQEENRDGDDAENEPASSGSATGSTPIWTFDLVAKMTSNPAVCTYDSTSRFILVQDAYHILYAVSVDGKKLWNAQLPGPILGSIQQLPDRSLVFTTPERLYRIDTEGDPLPGFSLHLPQKATDGAVASVEGENNIRIDIPARNHVLSYDGRGLRLQNQTRDHTATLPDQDPDMDTRYYIGPLIGDEGRYLLKSDDDRTLSCYRY